MLRKRWKMTALLILRAANCVNLLAVISEKIASYVFPDKNQKPLRMCRMQITKQALAILSPISDNGPRWLLVVLL